MPFSNDGVVRNPLQQKRDEHEPANEYAGLQLNIQADPALDHIVSSQPGALASHNSTRHMSTSASPASPASSIAPAPTGHRTSTLQHTMSPTQVAAVEGRQFGTFDVYEDMTEWYAPSLEQAQVYASQMHPRKSNTETKELEKISWMSTSLGRHCIPGGCGEQCDACGEGSTSSFQQFGSGLSNYFKFLKWLVRRVYFIFQNVSFPYPFPSLAMGILAASSLQYHTAYHQYLGQRLHSVQRQCQRRSPRLHHAGQSRRHTTGGGEAACLHLHTHTRR